MSDSIRRHSEMSVISRESTASRAQCFGSRLSRKKSTDTENIFNTNLRRCLSTFDITLLALGHMVGSGIYVLTSTVAKNIAGPAVIVAFILSGFASFLSALSYAELGVRYPRCGSGYSYTYLVLGELWAFLVGWNMALENVIGVAATARACSAYIDSLFGGIIRNATDTAVGPVHIIFVAQHMDFLAVGILLLFVAYLSFGIKMTSYLNNVFTVLNMLVIATIIGVGAYFSDITNWTNEETGGFMPYGWSGVLAASASCFYAYLGFDIIASAGEEANDPQKSIPKATMISMTIATVAYVGVSSVLTLMVNYKDIAEDSGLPEALSFHGAHWAQIGITVGALCGMSTAIIACLFALTRIVYVMSDDGLLFSFCSKVSEKTKTPLRAMYIFAFISAFLALMLDINTLVELMSIGTLFAYLIVSASVIVIRYRPTPLSMNSASHELSTISETSIVKSSEADNAGQFIQRCQWLGRQIRMYPGRLVTFGVLSYVITSFILCGFTKIFFSNIIGGCWWAILITAFLLLSLVLSFGIILLHQQSTTPLRYKVPLVPLVPALSILLNAILMVNLQPATWFRLLLWVCIGLCLYFSYGVEHSKLDVIVPENPSFPTTVVSADSDFDARRPVGALKRTCSPVVASQSREFLFSDQMK